jgi:hypothetical protein
VFVPRETNFSLLLIGGRSGVGKTSVGWEIASQFEAHVARSAAATYLEAAAPPWARRVRTDGKSIVAIATEVIAITGWLPSQRETP